jgi:hypothetical protein
MVKPTTAIGLLLGIIAACVSATATLVVVDSTRSVAPRPPVTQPVSGGIRWANAAAIANNCAYLASKGFPDACHAHTIVAAPALFPAP